MARCGSKDCGVSSGICGSLTFGSGELDDYGYWEISCDPCARYHESEHPEDGVCWPFKSEAEADGVMDGSIPNYEALHWGKTS